MSGIEREGIAPALGRIRNDPLTQAYAEALRPWAEQRRPFSFPTAGRVRCGKKQACDVYNPECLGGHRPPLQHGLAPVAALYERRGDGLAVRNVLLLFSANHYR